MSFSDSLLVDAFGLSIVFAVLIALSLIIKLITRVVGNFGKKEKPQEPVGQTAEQNLPTPRTEEAQYADGELKLYDVNEKTAALIMAIVSDESKIPLSQLQFKSIRLIKEEV